MRGAKVAIQGGIGWLAAGDMPKPLERVPFFVLRKRVIILLYYYIVCYLYRQGHVSVSFYGFPERLCILAALSGLINVGFFRELGIFSRSRKNVS